MEKIHSKKNKVLFNDGSYHETFEYIHLRKQSKVNSDNTLLLK
jgi:hypothetical protein